MVLDRVNKIKSNLYIYSNKKTANILDGTYNSIYKGKSLNFEDLREYVIGDNVKDIDWKASARSNNLLIKQFVAEKKHNIILVFDSSKKMLADTNSLDSKKEVAIMSLGTVAYIANKNGDYVAGIYNKTDSISYYPFKSTLFNIENILSSYEIDLNNYSNNDNLDKSLEYIIKYINRKAIIFIATDIYGASKISEMTLKKLAVRNNVLFININDAELSGESVYDIENEEYIPKLLLNNSNLIKADKAMKEELYKQAKDKLKRYAMPMVDISSVEEVVPKIIELLESHKYAK